MVMGNSISVKGWNDAAGEEMVVVRIEIPTGGDLDWLAPFAINSHTRVEQEQKHRATPKALPMNGTPPSSIPVTTNVEGNLIVNFKVAKAVEVKVTPRFLRKASRVIQ